MNWVSKFHVYKSNIFFTYDANVILFYKKKTKTEDAKKDRIKKI